ARIWDTSDLGDMPAADPSPSATTDWGEVEDYLVPYEAARGDPEIDIERVFLVSIPSGGTDDVGDLSVGVETPITWTIESQGATNDLNLTGDPALGSLVNCSVSVLTSPATPIGPGLTTTFDLGITPTAAGPFSFDVTVTSDDADEGTYTFAVQGDGSNALYGTYLVSNDPTESPDFASLGEAFDAVEAEGVLAPVVFEVSGGTGPYLSDAAYNLGDIPVAGLSATNTLVIRAEVGERPVIDGAGARASFRSGSEVGTLVVEDTGFVSIEALEVTGGVEFGIGVWVTQDAEVSDISVRGCRIHDVSKGNGILVAGEANSVPNVTIENNLVWDVAGGDGAFSLHARGAIAFFNVGANTVIRHNTVVVNSGVGLGAVLHHGGAGNMLADVSYNVFVAATPDFVIFYSQNAFGWSLVPSHSDHNVFFLTVGATEVARVQGNVHTTLAEWQASTGLDEHSLDRDPLLVGIAAGTEDLHLTAASYAIDQAVGSTATADIDGALRPQGFDPDIGAYEYPQHLALRALSDGAWVRDGDTVGVDVGDTVAGLVLQLQVVDPDEADTLDLATTVTDSGDIDGFLLGEWEATGTGGAIEATPSSGTFDVARDVEAQLDADDNAGHNASLTFVIAVQGPPSIAVTADSASVGDDGTVQVTEGDTVADLALDLAVTDPNAADVLNLATTITDGGGLITGLVPEEWSTAGSGGTIAATPSSGVFSTPGLVTLQLDATD
ncbi:MAG: hypothetical protein JRI25_25310, partial [Deltaproteobacteria bacterium]|nr:hypothetical protein [Deltaproteobacteria bacterium]